MLRGFVLGIDRMLCRRLGIREFTADARCLFRIARERAESDVSLSDGTRIAAGEPLLEVHLWNEHLPRLPARGSDLAWAARAARLTDHSLRLLAAHVAADPALRDIRALHGRMALPAPRARDAPFALARRMGFDVRPLGGGGAARFYEFWKNVHLCALIWAFNPGRLRNLRGGILRWSWFDLWMSRDLLLARYASRARSGAHHGR